MLAAKQGYHVSQYNVAILYEDGRGVDKSLCDAVYWYKLASDQNDQNALNKLGYLKKGHVLGKSVADAFNLYQKSALQGNNLAQCRLGNMYQTGRGTEIDLETAASWYKKSPLQNNQKAQFNLSMKYIFEYQTDIPTAMYWLRKSADQGFEKALRF